jgi:anti-sigma regulatory factor (Ser/Thr protein kinase)
VDGEFAVVGELALRRTLTRSRAATRDARQDLALWMPERCGDRSAEIAVVLTAELVTNALLHTEDGEIELHATCDGVRLRVAVADPEPSPPESVDSPAAPLAGSGQGMWLVDNLATRWGSDVLPRGKRVWFEVPCAVSRTRNSSGEWTVPDQLEVEPGKIMRTYWCTPDQLRAASDARLREARRLIWESDELYALADERDGV